MSITIRDLAKRYDGLISKIYILIRDKYLPHRIIEKYFPKEGKILDVGCGFGSYALYLALKEPKRSITGIDLNKNRIEEAKKASRGLKNIDFYCKDFTKDFKLTKCNVISFIDLLHHVPVKTQTNLIKEAHLKLEKNGIIILKDVARKPRWKYLYNYIHDKLMTKGDKLFFRSCNEHKNTLMNEGFKIIKGPELLKISMFNPIPHFIIIARKNE